MSFYSCIVIGAENYSDSALSKLEACKNDADNVFDTFTDPTFGVYDEGRSIKLISPKLSDIQATFDEINRASKGADVFTFYYSGHGALFRENLYLCAQDTCVDRLSTTGLQFSYIIGVLKELSPRVTNVIIDACEAGGIAGDLRQIVSPEILGPANSQGLNIFASSASDGPSAATLTESIATASFLKCLRGEIRVQSSRKQLNLTEVGAAVTADLKTAGVTQTPVSWGLNLFGDPYLSLNPHYEETAGAQSYMLAGIPASSAEGKLLSHNTDALWKIYSDGSITENITRLISAIKFPLSKLPPNSGAISAFINGVSGSFSDRATGEEDEFAGILTRSSCIVSLLSQFDTHPEAEIVAKELCGELSDALNAQLEQTLDSIRKDYRNLLSIRGGLSDLFILPLRLTSLLGWCAANIAITDILQRDITVAAQIAEQISEEILEHYQSSLVCNSDSQSPSIFLALMQLHKCGKGELAENVFSYLFNDFITSKGKIASCDIDDARTFDFVVRKASGNWNEAGDILAQPDHMLATFLYFANEAGLSELVDPYLRNIDHLPSNIFVPENLLSFADDIITTGVNVTFHVGLESHFGIFTTKDFKTLWECECETRLQLTQYGTNQSAQICSILASLLMPNRIAWNIR